MGTQENHIPKNHIPMVGPITTEETFMAFMENVKRPLISIHRALAQGKNLAVVGAPQTGKTSLLLHCADNDIEGRTGVYIDLYAATDMPLLGRYLAESADESLLDPNLKEKYALYIDEADAIADNPKLGEPAISLLEQVAQRTPIVVGAHIPLEAIHPRLKSLVPESVTMPVIPQERRPKV